MDGELTCSCANELETAGKGGLDHLPGVDTPFGLAELKQRIYHIVIKSVMSRRVT